MNVEIGDVVKDVISGLIGTVTARVEYITKCVQYLVTPKWKQGETFSEGHWIDEIRLNVVRDKPKASPKAPRVNISTRRTRRATGAGPSAPKRSGGKVGTTE